MRIAIVSDTYKPEINGVVTSIVNFSEYLAAHGHEVLIITPKYDKKRDLVQQNITIKRFPSLSYATNKNTRIAFPSIFAIISELRKFKPDIVHVQTPMTIGVSGIMAARVLKLKCIQTYHTYIPDFMVYVNPYNVFGFDRLADSIASMKIIRKIVQSDMFEVSEDFLDDQVRKSLFTKRIRKISRRYWKKGESNIGDRFAWDFSRILYNRSDLVITPSRTLAKLLKRHRIKPPVVDVSNGIDYHDFTKKSDYKITHKIFSVGRLGVEGKNVDVVIKSFALALKTRPDLVLDIGGDGPARGALERLVEDLKIGRSVNFRGFISHADLKREYHGADAFITASTMETQGLVILEAMAAGLPVIGVDALAVPEYVKNNKNGYLVKPGDIKAMAEAILRLTESPERNERFGKTGLKLASKHDLPACAEKLERVYADVLAGNSFRKKK